MKQIQLNQAVEEIDIGGEVYEIDMSDQKRKEYNQAGQHLEKRMKEIEAIEANTEEEQDKLLTEIKDILKSTTDEILGDGAFENLYPKTNYSTVVLTDTLYQVTEYIRQKDSELLQRKKDKYTKYKKKK